MGTKSKVTQDKTEWLRPAQVVARRVAEARESRGWSQAELTRRLEEVGYNKSASALSKLEGGLYRGVSLDDAFALAAALGVSPVWLFTPREDDAPVAIAPAVRLEAKLVRDWIRGLPLPLGPELDLRQIPDSELIALVAEELARRQRMSPLSRALMGDRLLEAAREFVDRIHAREQEEVLDG